jgi:peptidoglycan/xylan/chitin deacetylase (PgdA/CDA1 family)
MGRVAREGSEYVDDAARRAGDRGCGGRNRGRGGGRSVEPLGAATPAGAATPGPAGAAPATTTVATTAAPVATGPPTPSAPFSPLATEPMTRAEIESRYAAIAPRAWGLEVPGVITRLSGAGRAIALTFDACGGPGGHGYDAALIALLRRQQVPATLFVNARWIDANPAVFADLAADPLFDIGNHGTRHLPLSVRGRSAYGIRGTGNVGEVFDEVDGNAGRLLGLLGHPAGLFRSGTAFYDDVATRVVRDLGERVVGFEVNGDGGATFSPRQVARALGTVRPGSIVIAHLNHPGHGTEAGLRAALPALRGAGYRFVQVADYVR